MNGNTKELLKKAQGDNLLGGCGGTPGLRPEFMVRLTTSLVVDSAAPGATLVLKMSLVGAAVAVTFAFAMTKMVTAQQEEAAATVWSDIGEAEVKR